MKPIVITKGNFASEVLQSDIPVIVDFWADWCGPCKQLSPLIDELSHQYNGRVKFVKINADEEADLAAEYGVRGLPTLLTITKGTIQSSRTGSSSKSSLQAWVDDALTARK